jgi:hypothetical protein
VTHTNCGKISKPRKAENGLESPAPEKLCSNSQDKDNKSRFRSGTHEINNTEKSTAHKR